MQLWDGFADSWNATHAQEKERIMPLSTGYAVNKSEKKLDSDPRDSTDNKAEIQDANYTFELQYIQASDMMKSLTQLYSQTV